MPLQHEPQPGWVGLRPLPAGPGPLCPGLAVLVLRPLPGAVVPGAEQRSHQCAVSARATPGLWDCGCC